MPSLGELTVALGALTGPFRQDLSDARGEIKSTESSMRSMVNTAGKLGVAAGVAGAAIISGLVKSGLDAIDSQAKLARNIGATINGLRGLQLVAVDYGVSQEEINRGVEIFTQRLGQAKREGGPAAEMLKQLGLNASDLSRMDVDERIATIADRVHALGLSTEQTADLLRQFGIRSSEMVDMLRQGGDAIRSARKDVEDFGLSVSEVDARKVEEAGDAIDRIGRVVEGVRNQITIALAPILTELAERFNNTAKANKGWGDTVRSVVESAIRGFGKVLDVIHGLRVTLKAAELVATGFGAAFYSAGQLILEVFTRVVDGVTGAINVGIRAVNKLGGSIDEIPSWANSDFMEGVRDFANKSRDQVGIVREELHNLAMEEMPSAKFEGFLQAVAARAQTAAESLERAQAAMGNQGAEGFGVDTTEEDKKKQKELEALREHLQDRIEAIAENLSTEEELQQAHYEKDLEALQAAEEQKLITAEDFMILRQKLEEDNVNKLTEIRKKNMSDLERFTSQSYSKQAATVIASLANMTAGVAQHSKTMFEINKVAGIANAVVNTAQGVTQALAAYPPPISFVMAAAQAAAGLAQIQAIKSAQFGGGGGAPSIAGSTPATPVSPVTSGAPGGASDQQTVRIQGLDPTSIFSGRQVVDLLNSAVKDGAKLVLE